MLQVVICFTREGLMRESEVISARERVRLASFGAVFIIIMLCIALFVGCGKSGSDSVSYVGSETGGDMAYPSATVPFQNDKLDMLTDDEKTGSGMASSYLGMLGASIYETTLRRNTQKSRSSRDGEFLLGFTTGVLSDIANDFIDTDKPNFNYVTNQLNNINLEMQQLNAGIMTIQLQLIHMQVDMINNMGNEQIQNYVNNINNGFSAGTYNLINFSQNAAYFDPSPGPTPTDVLPFQLPTPTISPTSTPTFYPASSLAVVQGWIPNYSNQMLDDTNYSMPASINGIATQINDQNLLINYVNTLILNPQPSGSPSPSPSPSATYSPNPNLNNQSNVMSAYLLLEKYFLMLYTEQLKGLVIFANCDLYNNDPNGSLFKNYMNDTFKPEFQKEVAAFNQATDYLVLNLADYRTLDQFNSDNQYLAQGIAKDTVYYQTLARAHFVSAVLLNSFGGDTGGLYGNIITPLNYTSSGSSLIQAAPSPLVNLSGSPAPGPMTQATASYNSIYPYPSWNTTSSPPAVSCDNQWAVFELSNTSIPAGTYTFTLNDKGSSTTPWNHTSNQLGTASVMYYCPNGDTKDYPPQSSPSTTNTLKFGFISGRWNFGNEVFSNAPFSNWFVSSDQIQYTWDGFICDVDNPALLEDAESTPPSYFSKDYATYLYPYTGNTSSTDLINTMGAYPDTFSDKDHQPWFTGYEIYYPFTASQGSVTPAPPPSSGTVNVSYIFNASGGFTGNQNTSANDYILYYGIFAKDSKSGDCSYLVNENNQFGTSLNWYNISKITTETGHEIDMKCKCYFLNDPTGTYSQYLKWYVQILYDGFVNIFN